MAGAATFRAESCHYHPVPVLRALPEIGQSYDDPSEDLLFELLGDIEQGNAGVFLIVERTTDPSGQTYAQAYRNEDGTYVVEHRAGSAEAHFKTDVSDMRAAHALLAAWAFDLPYFKHFERWQRISL